jgi:hypothetical protein
LEVGKRPEAVDADITEQSGWPEREFGWITGKVE